MVKLPMSYYSRIMRDAPTAYYRFSEASGTSALDSSGNGNTATISSGTTLGQAGAILGDPNKAFLFDGTSGHVSTPLSAAGVSAITLELWVKPSGTISGSPRVIANSHTDADNNGFQLELSSSGGAFFIGTGSSNKDSFFSFNFISTAYSHVVCTYNGANLYIYCNAQQVGMAAMTGNISASGYNIAIGYNPAYSGDYFAGYVDEVAIYLNKALSQDQITAHYHAGIDGQIVGRIR